MNVGIPAIPGQPAYYPIVLRLVVESQVRYLSLLDLSRGSLCALFDLKVHIRIKGREFHHAALVEY
jgi:hypothetical protein